MASLLPSYTDVISEVSLVSPADKKSIHFVVNIL
jgi:hypothetical protein